MARGIDKEKWRREMKTEIAPRVGDKKYWQAFMTTNDDDQSRWKMVTRKADEKRPRENDR